MTYEEKLQLFFACIESTRMTLYKFAQDFSDRKIVEIINKLNDAQNLIFKIAVDKEIKLDFELNNLKMQSDYSFYIYEFDDKMEYKNEIKDMAKHILQHFGELTREHLNANEFHFVYALEKCADEFYNITINYY
ncbi:MAG: hypothetical protein SOZ22_00600 [Ezakiella sp.]|nr:hypothetical protein [Ezakiella sp.]